MLGLRREVPTRDIVRLDVVRPAMIEQLLTRERGELTRLEHE
jgi:hypothetical protein